MVLQDEITDTANIFIDDLLIKGSKTQYLDGEGNPEVLKKNLEFDNLSGNMLRCWPHYA